MEMEVVPRMVGFEDEEYGGGCLHADFANMYLGGGVLSGGCVQASTLRPHTLVAQGPMH